MRHRGYLLGIALSVSVFSSGAALGDSPSAAAAVKQLMTKDLVGEAGKEILMSTVTYPPGGSSPPRPITP
jgi:hypothetical protein